MITLGITREQLVTVLEIALRLGRLGVGPVAATHIC
jgi:hypothetical protein